MAIPGSVLGIFGGTFNPIHIGHLRAAEEVAGLFNLDKVIFVPSARPPHKSPAPVIDFQHRLAMVRIAVAERPGFLASDLEGRREGFSYTFETIEYFKAEYGESTRLLFLTGLDAFLAIDTWKEYRRLFDMTDFVVFTRPGAGVDLMGSLLQRRICPDYHWDEAQAAYCAPSLKKVYFKPITMIDVSSTSIRKMIRKGRSIRFLLPEGVRRYIIENKLYQMPKGTVS